MKLVSKTLLALYLLVLLWVVLFKFSLDLSSALDYRTGLNLIPFADTSQGNLGEMIFNFVVFIPFGLLLSVNLKRAVFGQKLAFVFLFSLALEMIQFVFAIGITDVTDIITNTSGGLLGLILYGLSSKPNASKKLNKSIVVASALLLILLPSVLLSRNVRLQLTPSAQTAPLQVALAKDVQLAWPTVGQAAVGSVEDGLLASSSDNEKPRPTASMAKVIAALALMEKQSFELGQTGQSYTLTAEDVANYHAYAARDGSVVPVHEGMVLTQYQALQMMLIASANNMADTLVEREFGSMEAYTSYAQDMVQRMGLSQTVVADASGFSSATVSTPSELVTVGIAALKNPVIAEIVAQPQAWIPGIGVVTNTNELLGTDGVVGIKTGTTNEAGSCLLFAARQTADDGQEMTIVGVIMGDKNAASLYSDSRKLLTSMRQGFGLVEAQSTGNVVEPPPKHKYRAPR